MTDPSGGFFFGFGTAIIIFILGLALLSDNDPKFVKTETVVYICQPQ